jgi:hypothetical protein
MIKMRIAEKGLVHGHVVHMYLMYDDGGNPLLQVHLVKPPKEQGIRSDRLRVKLFRADGKSIRCTGKNPPVLVEFSRHNHSVAAGFFFFKDERLDSVQSAQISYEGETFTSEFEGVT